MTEAEKRAECLAEVMTWMREPDWIETASIEWLIGWVERRPIAALGMAAILCPSQPPQMCRPEDSK